MFSNNVKIVEVGARVESRALTVEARIEFIRLLAVKQTTVMMSRAVIFA